MSNKVEFIVVHHTATARSTTVSNIRSMHVDGNGWRDIGYHWLIRQPEGDKRATITMGRKHNLDDNWEPWEYGAHSKGENSISVSVALVGNFQEDKMPRDMKARLVEHLAFLCAAFELDPMKAVKGHKEMPNASTVCPGKFRMASIRAAVAEKLSEAS